MLAYPRIDPVALSLGPLPGALVWADVSVRISGGVGTRALARLAFGMEVSRLERPARRRHGHLDHDRRNCRCAAGVRPVLRPVFVRPRSCGGFPGLERRHVVSWWTDRRSRQHLVVEPEAGLPVFDVVDFVAPMVPPGLLFGRLGNFINGELWGGVTDGRWG